MEEAVEGPRRFFFALRIERRTGGRKKGGGHAQGAVRGSSEAAVGQRKELKMRTHNAEADVQKKRCRRGKK